MKYIKVRIIVSACILLFSCIGYSQIKIEGFIKDSFNTPISNVSVVANDSEENILTYTYTNTSGKFLLTIEKFASVNEIVVLKINSLGYKEVSDIIKLEDGKTSYNVSFILEVAAESLKEILLQPDDKIYANGNVTTIKATPFMDQTEENVEDLLEKIPGVEVMEDGSIKAHGKFIKKLMVDGDDLFASDYQLLTKNLDAKTIDAVQIIDSFQDNPVLAKVLNSEDVALNLELKDKFKNIWFGNVLLGAGLEERFNANANIGLLKKKIKFFYLADGNNLGTKAADQVQGVPTSINITSAYREEEIEPEITPVFSINKNENTILKNNQSTFNTSLMNSLGFVTKLRPNMEIRATGAFTTDKQQQKILAETIFSIDEEPIVYTENNNTDHRNIVGFGELELKYTGAERSYIRNLFSYKNNPEKYDNRLFFNEENIEQQLQKNEFALYNHLNYSYALGNKNVWHTYLYLGKNEVSQNTSLQSPYLNEFFEIDDSDNITEQNTNDQLTIAGVKTIFFSDLGKMKNRITTGYESLKINSNTKLYFNENEMTTEDSLQNVLNFKNKKLFLEDQLSYSFSKKVKLYVGASLDHLNLSTGLISKENWFFNPSINLNFKELFFGRFSLKYKRDYTTPESNLFFQNVQLSSYNTFLQGADSIDFVMKDKYSFFYRWNNNLESKAITFSINYEDYNGKYATLSEIDENLQFVGYQFNNEGSKQVSSSLSFASFFDKLNFSTNMSLSQNWSTTPFLVNSSQFMDLQLYTANYLMTATTYFKMPLNFRFKVNYNYSKSNFNNIVSKTNWSNWASSLTYKITEGWMMKINNEYYKMPIKNYYFLNAVLSYQPTKTKFSYRLVFNNLTNNSNFESILIDNYITYISSVPLLSRYIFASVKYRF